MLQGPCCKLRIISHWRIAQLLSSIGVKFVKERKKNLISPLRAILFRHFKSIFSVRLEQTLKFLHSVKYLEVTVISWPRKPIIIVLWKRCQVRYCSFLPKFTYELRTEVLCHSNLTPSQTKSLILAWFLKLRWESLQSDFYVSSHALWCDTCKCSHTIIIETPVFCPTRHKVIVNLLRHANCPPESSCWFLTLLFNGRVTASWKLKFPERACVLWMRVKRTYLVYIIKYWCIILPRGDRNLIGFFSV